MARVAVRRTALAVPGCVLWLDASDVSTLYQDSDATTPVVADADPVGAWTNKAALGGRATQATALKRPVYRTGVQNGKAAVQMDGATSWMTLPTNTAYVVETGVSAFGVWIVEDHVPAANPMLLTLTYKDDPQWVLELFYAIATVEDPIDHFFVTVYDASDVSRDTRRMSEASPLGAHVFGAVATVGGNMVAYQDGVTIVGETIASMGCPYTNNWAILGANIGGQSRWMNGYVCEVLVWNRALTAPEIVSIQTYLSNKWGIAL